MGLGGSVFLTSLIGVLGSKRESPCLLRLYSASLLLVLLGVLGCAIALASVGPEQLQRWATANWTPVVEQNLVSISQYEFEELLAKNKVGLITLLSLLLLVLTFDLLMVWVLQCSVSMYGRRYQETERLMRKSNHESIEMDELAD